MSGFSIADEDDLSRKSSVEDLAADPDADAGAHNRHDDVADQTGCMEADQTKQGAAYGTAQNAQNDIAQSRGAAAHDAAGNVAGQSAHQNTKDKAQHSCFLGSLKSPIPLNRTKAYTGVSIQ